MVAEQLIIGRVEGVSAGAGHLRLDRAALDRLVVLPDSAAALSGSVGGQVKIKVDGKWVLGKLRDTRLADGGGDAAVLASIDFIGEGNEGLAHFLYGRGIAALRLGREAEGWADMARATALNPAIAETYARNGVRP